MNSDGDFVDDLDFPDTISKFARLHRVAVEAMCERMLTTPGDRGVLVTRRWDLANNAASSHVELSDDVLDRIDEIVAPGVMVNPGDNGWQNPALEPEERRRR